MSVETAQIWLKQYQRALRFVLPHWKRLAGVTLIGLFATAIGLAQPYFSKLLIDSALLRRDMRALVLGCRSHGRLHDYRLRPEHHFELSIRSNFGTTSF
jgi:hypothetical protein